MADILVSWSNRMREEMEMDEENEDSQVQAGQSEQTDQADQAGQAEAFDPFQDLSRDSSDDTDDEDNGELVEPLVPMPRWNKRKSIQEQRDEREELDVSRVTWPHLYGKDGDTLVVVDFPQFNAKACNGLPWYGRKEFRVESAILLDTRSAFFEKALSERQQSRYRRRLKLNDLPSGIKFILDLTPSQEGDEAAALLADLSVPTGARDWWMSKERLGVPTSLVSGHDDVCAYHDSMPDNCIKTEGHIPASQPGSDDDFKFKVTLSLTDCAHCYEREIRDYCEIRHRANIIRLLLCLAGHDLVLNSAPRVYTIVGLAKYFDVTSLVSSHVRAWLEQHNNSSFIDVHPEIAIDIAWKLQLSDMVRTPLRIIVVERVLEPDATKVNPVTVFGRPRTSLADDISEVVQHATIAARSRTMEAVRNLVSDGSANAYEWLQIPAWRHLVSIRDTMQSELKEIRIDWDLMEAQKYVAQIDQILNAMNQYIANTVQAALAAMPYPTQVEAINSDRLAYLTQGTSAQQFNNIISTFSDEQFLLMQVFWSRFQNSLFKWEGFKTMYIPDPSHPVPRTLAGIYQDFFWALERPHTAKLFPSLFEFDPEGPKVSLHEIHNQLIIASAEMKQRWCPLPEELETPLRRSQHLALGMTEDEFGFLPLWAGGLDDGTGAAFTDMAVPDTDMGPIEPGPGYRTGQTVASSTADSDATIIGGGVSLRVAASGSTTNTSFVEVDHEEVLSLSDDEDDEEDFDDYDDDDDSLIML
ncbi:hypothetical protein PFICI_09745 [Pestalotiopsis fici W106-1]|uniref:Uncharacterized protein n=1 Tax=Pestalotiopsis fici (strain W106-1 / CGMCC3.15140) TaxID=1229662 RepID=W3WUY8_PESFW|nr:uncharacterized protein PFICI_09745 [Pestalotiopsis fici W106-1]ETS77683.1 hypothetical protein PFICI_09745 [Pestalotiopsis fici W106-1]